MYKILVDFLDIRINLEKEVMFMPSTTFTDTYRLKAENIQDFINALEGSRKVEYKYLHEFNEIKEPQEVEVLAQRLAQKYRTK